jgi:hypothetical protein
VPQTFRLPGEEAPFLEVIGRVGDARTLEGVLELVRRHDATSVLVEDDYVDAHFRDEYAHF